MHGKMWPVTGVRQRDKSVGREFWRKFEEEVERAVTELGNAKVRRDVRVPGVLSGRRRQIDVLATGEVAGCPTTVIFEAKCYAGSVQIGTIDELVGKALDVAAQHAVLYAPNGFSQGARARAAGTQSSPLRIGVGDLEVDWPELPGRVLSNENVYDSVSRISENWAYPSVPVETDDYGRFFRGEAPLFVSR